MKRIRQWLSLAADIAIVVVVVYVLRYWPTDDKRKDEEQ